MNINPRKSYTGKVVLGFSLVVLIGAVVGTVVFFNVSDKVRTEQETTLEKQADIQANFSQTQIKQELSFTEELASNIESKKGLSQVELELSNLATAQEIRRTHYGKAGGEILASSAPQDFRGKSFSQVGYPATQTVWDQQKPAVAFRQANGESSWVFIAPVDFQQTNGVLVREFKATAFVDNIDTIVPGSRTRLVSSDGTVVLDTENPDAIGSPHVKDGRSPAVEKAVRGSAGIMTVNGDQSGTGKEVVVGYDKIEGTDWVVVSYSEPSTLYALATSVGQSILLLLGSIALMLIGFGVVVERPTIRSISQLTEDASELRDGNLDVEIETSRTDDIGELFETFDAMRQGLKDRIEEVETARKEAEVARKEAENERKEAERRRKRLQETANRYGQTMSKCADGDLTEQLDPDEENDAMEKIAEEFNYMIDQIEAAIAQVKQFSDNVIDRSDVVMKSTSELENASSQIAESVQIITDETEQLNNDSETLTRELDELTQEIEAGNTEEVPVSRLRELADELTALTERTRETLSESENIAAAAEEQTAALTEVNETARNLDRSADSLADLLDDFETTDEHTFYFGTASPVSRKETEE